MHLIKELSEHFSSERIKARPIDLYAYASDASFYYLVPKVVVLPGSTDEIRLLFTLAKKHNTPLTFRTAGTSLSGQAVTDGILVDLSRYWDKAWILNNGEEVRVQPGITGNSVNQLLKKYGRKIGPDPASINAAMMGGILANNSSGMCCGVLNNSYHTLKSLRVLLPNGLEYDTADPAHYKKFRDECSDIFAGLELLKNKVVGNKQLAEKIRQKYTIKNTVGYGLNAFIDFEHPLDILAHLMIGSEGTLGFIAEATLRTIPDKPFKKTGLLTFSSPRAACDAVEALTATGPEALEFMDRAALRSVEHMPEATSFLKDLPGEAACILCEYQADTADELSMKFMKAEAALALLPVINTTEFTTNASLQYNYWKLRKGMYPSVAAVRARGTSVMLEDVAVPPDRLGDAIADLQELFRKYNYNNAIVFGHAKEGNLHFLISQSIATKKDIELFEAFNDELAALIIHRYNGSLKAEHGTGRQIAPYVQDEWGDDAYMIMQELKALIDPDNILNPGVILTNDKKSHLKNLKSLPVVEEEVDKCVECGYCEQRCPSKDYTLTPRQRIVLRRALVRLKENGDQSTYDSIVKDYQHDGIATCAVDGLCAGECPVDINTGDLIKRLRRENHSDRANNMALKIAGYFAAVETAVQLGISAGGLINKISGRKTMHRFTKLIRRMLPSFPLWPLQLTRPIYIKRKEILNSEAIYFTCCINRMMGNDIERKDSIVDVMLRLAEKAKIKVTIPSDIKGACCGQAFSSKGFTAAHRYMVNKTIAAMWQWTKHGNLPVVLDITSCTFSLQNCMPLLTPENQLLFDRLTIIDSITFTADTLLPRLKIPVKKEQIIIHPVCSVQKMKLTGKLQEIGNVAATNAIIPIHSGCCGMAGDRGFYYPGLIEAATKKECREVNSYNCADCYSTGKPCEMAMSESTGKNFRSILYLLDDVSIMQ